MTLGRQHEKPVYVRLRETIADSILAGKYADGDPLPSVRAFAAEQQANPLTVAKAYQGFQDEGLIVAKRGVGMFVAPGARTRLGNSVDDYPKRQEQQARKQQERDAAADERETARPQTLVDGQNGIDQIGQRHQSGARERQPERDATLR